MRRFFMGLAITAALGIIPCQAHGDDQQIAKSIVKRLEAEKITGGLKGFNIDLEVDHGAVYLKGSVASADQERIALDAARRVDGVRQVYNELTVKSVGRSSKLSTAIPAQTQPEKATTGLASSRRQVVPAKPVEAQAEAKPAAPDSRELAERIIERLKVEKAAGKLKGMSIDVEVDDGVAWLKGKAATPEQQNLILDVVRHVPGVKQVVNELAIAQTTKSPTEIAQEVVNRLEAKKASGELKGFGVDLEVDQGIVWVSGHAANEEQQQKILDTVRHIPGVAKVVNDLTISAATTASVKQPAPLKDAEESQATQAHESAAPRTLALPDAPIGTAVASNLATAPDPLPLPAAPPAVLAPVQPQLASQAPAPQPVAARQPTLQYVFVPATQQPMTVNRGQMPLAFAPAQAATYQNVNQLNSQPVPMNGSVPGMGIAPARFDHPQLPQYAWPSYSPYPNYGAVTYPKQYSPSAWPYIGPFYPYPQVPLGWRKVELKWKDGWWMLDFKDR